MTDHEDDMSCQVVSSTCPLAPMATLRLASLSKLGGIVQCALRAGQFHAAVLTVCRAW